MSHKTPKDSRESRSTSRNTTNSEDANSKTMDALAKAVGVIEASINSFREENRASIASLHTTLNALGQRITSVEEGPNELDKRNNTRCLSGYDVKLLEDTHTHTHTHTLSQKHTDTFCKCVFEVVLIKSV